MTRYYGKAFKGMKVRDCLVTKAEVFRLEPQPAFGEALCHECALSTPIESKCHKAEGYKACGGPERLCFVQIYVRDADAVDQARDLLTLKGELL